MSTAKSFLIHFDLIFNTVFKIDHSLIKIWIFLCLTFSLHAVVVLHGFTLYLWYDYILQINVLKHLWLMHTKAFEFFNGIQMLLTFLCEPIVYLRLVEEHTMLLQLFIYLLDATDVRDALLFVEHMFRVLLVVVSIVLTKASETPCFSFLLLNYVHEHKCVQILIYSDR